MAKKGRFLQGLQQLGKSLMTPVAALPAAALLLRLGQADLWKWTSLTALENGIPWMASAGSAIFGNLPLIFAIGIAVGFAEGNNGVAAIAASIGYLVLTKVAVSFDKTIDMGVLAGIIIGIMAGKLYNKYKTIKLPDFLGFFGGKRFIPIVTSFYSLILGILCGYVWPLIQNGLTRFGNAVADAGSIGGFVFGLLNRLLIPFGLHHVLNTLFWFQFGEFKDATGNIVKGDLNRFFSLDKTAGPYMTGFFPIMMFALPAACLAMITTAKKENRKAVTGMLLGVALTSFLTGITEPIEFSFMFLSPVLYGTHAVLTGIALAVTNALGIRMGFGFSAGLFDYVLNIGISAKPLLLLLICIIFAILYYFIFVFTIVKLNIPTPGRGEDEAVANLSNLSNSEIQRKSLQILEALGGKENIHSIDACITRIRLTAVDSSLVDEGKLKEIGVSAVLKMGDSNYQIIVGTIADIMVTHVKDNMK